MLLRNKVITMIPATTIKEYALDFGARVSRSTVPAQVHGRTWKDMKNDERGIGQAIGEVLGLVILDVIALALVPTIAASATSAAGNLTANPSAAGMVNIVVLFYIIVLLVANVAVVMWMLKTRGD